MMLERDRPSLAAAAIAIIVIALIITGKATGFF